MSRRAWVTPLVVFCVLLVCLVVALLVPPRGPAHRDSDWEVRELNALAREQGPLSDAERQTERMDFARLAEGDPEFLNWLVGVVTSDDADMDVRFEALHRLLEIREEVAFRDMARALQPWLKWGWSSREEATLQNGARNEIRRVLLQTDLPAEDILSACDEDGRGWRAVTYAFGTPPLLQVASSASQEEKKRARRYSEVLALARSRDEAKLMAKVLAEAPLAEGVKPELADLARLADTDPAFRKWLAGVVASPEEDVWVRVAAFRPLLGIQSDAAVRDLIADLRGWFRALDADAERNREGRDLQGLVSELMLDRLLLTDLPIEEVLELTRTAFPFWDMAAGSVALRHSRGQTPWSEEQCARLQERAGQLLRFWKAWSTGGAKQQAAAAAE